MQRITSHTTLPRSKVSRVFVVANLVIQSHRGPFIEHVRLEYYYVIAHQKFCSSMLPKLVFVTVATQTTARWLRHSLKVPSDDESLLISYILQGKYQIPNLAPLLSTDLSYEIQLRERLNTSSSRLNSVEHSFFEGIPSPIPTKYSRHFTQHGLGFISCQMYRETNLYWHNRTRTATTGTSMRHTWSEISDICCGCRSRTQFYQCARTEQWVSLRVARRNLRDANECGLCACMRECILTLAQLPTEPKEKSVSSTVRLCPRVRNCGSV